MIETAPDVIRILIVDDSAIMRNLIVRSLQLSGIQAELREADNGESALHMMGLEKFSLVLLDLHMPVMNGREVIAHLRASPKFGQFPIIVISSDRTAQDIPEIRDTVAGFLHKPFTPSQLGQSIRQVLRSQ